MNAPITGRVTLRKDPFAGRAGDMAGAAGSVGRAAMVLGSSAGRDRHPVVHGRTGQGWGRVELREVRRTVSCAYVAGSAHERRARAWPRMGGMQVIAVSNPSSSGHRIA